MCDFYTAMWSGDRQSDSIPSVSLDTGSIMENYQSVIRYFMN